MHDTGRRDEKDGFDEVVAPVDATRSVKTAILDDQLSDIFGKKLKNVHVFLLVCK